MSLNGGKNSDSVSGYQGFHITELLGLKTQHLWVGIIFSDQSSQFGLFLLLRAAVHVL